jgi:hypothetical protein
MGNLTKWQIAHCDNTANVVCKCSATKAQSSLFAIASIVFAIRGEKYSAGYSPPLFTIVNARFGVKSARSVVYKIVQNVIN